MRTSWHRAVKDKLHGKSYVLSPMHCPWHLHCSSTLLLVAFK